MKLGMIASEVPPIHKLQITTWFLCKIQRKGLRVLTIEALQSDHCSHHLRGPSDATYALRSSCHLWPFAAKQSCHTHVACAF